jgi:hypothetical protein
MMGDATTDLIVDRTMIDDATGMTAVPTTCDRTLRQWQIVQLKTDPPSNSRLLNKALNKANLNSSVL